MLTLNLPSVWVRHFGLAFDPFEHLEASSDRRLGDYLIGHRQFPVIWENAPALVFARHGGGKTAMRVFGARQAWKEKRAFPIVYLPSIHGRYDPHASLSDHMAAIVRATSASLLLGIAFQPEIFLALERAGRRALVASFADTLPDSLEYFLEVLRAEQTPLALWLELDRLFVLPEPPRELVREFCDALEFAHVDVAPRHAPPPHVRWQEQIEIIFDALDCRSVDLLIDGVDSATLTFGNPEAQAEWIAPLLDQAPVWASEKIYLKAFVPLRSREAIEERVDSLEDTFRASHLEWDAPNLAELLRARLSAASGGRIGSLDAVAEEDVHDAETEIAQSVIPLPREALLATQLVLEKYIERVGDQEERISLDDVSRALAEYQDNAEWLNLGALASPA